MLMFLFVMIRLVLDYCACPVYLFGKDEPHHLVRECHARQRQLGISPPVHVFGKAVRPAYDERHVSCRQLLVLYPCGQFRAAHLLAVFVEQGDKAFVLDAFQYQLSFFFLLLFLAQAFAVLNFRNHLYIKRYVVIDTFRIVFYPFGIQPVGRPAYKQQSHFHRYLS